MERYFDEIVISSEGGLIKPSSEMLHHILKKMQITPAEVVFIDDSQKNIDAAQAVGLTGLLFRDSKTLQTDLQRLGVQC